MSIINTNIMATRARAAMGQSNRLEALSMQKLSTGKAINSAKDNAAGLAISNKLAAQIRGLAQAVRNVQDGQSLAQTTDGALGTLTDMSQRMRELAVQSVNGTLSDADRASLDGEFQQLKRQMSSTVDQTVWNGITVLNPKLAVRQAVVPASVSSDAAINTSAPATGNYNLFINGQTVSVNLVQNEAGAARLQKITSAIAQTAGLQNVSTRVTSGGGLEIYTADGSDLSVWYNASVAGLKAANFGLGTQATAQVSRITLADKAAAYPVVEQTSSYVQFSGYGGSGEQLAWPSSAAASTVAGAFSMVSGVLYKGDGTTAVSVGTVDPVFNGLNGEALRINFKASFPNANFEEAADASGKVPGWTTYEQQVRLGGSSQIAGFATPYDATASPSGTRDVATSAGGTYDAQLVSGGASSGSQSLRLTLTGLSVPPYGVAHGPAVVSDEAVTITGGESISFDWRAQRINDDYDVYAYLLNVDTGATVELLNQTGTSSAWATKTTTVPSTGNYKFVFLSGTYDASGGQAAGAQLDIDNIKVSSARPPYEPSASDVSLFESQVAYRDATPFSISATINGTVVSSGAATSKDAALTALNTQIASRITDGTLSSLQVTRQGDSLQLTSTVPGTPFTLSQATTTAQQRTFDSALVTAGQAHQDKIDAITGGNAASTGAMVIKGTPASASSLANAHLISIQAGANQDQVVMMELPDYGVPGGGLDALLWDTSADEWRKATQQSGEWSSAQGDALAHIKTADGAMRAMTLSDQVISSLNSDRVEMGAKLSRLSSAGSNLSNMHLHQSSSLSGISDTDFAAEASKLMKQQIVQKAATSVLAQANLTPETVLQLLKDI